MGKKINCTSTPRGRKSKDQGGGKKSKVVQLYTPLLKYRLLDHCCTCMIAGKYCLATIRPTWNCYGSAFNSLCCHRRILVIPERSISGLANERRSFGREKTGKFSPRRTSPVRSDAQDRRGHHPVFLGSPRKSHKTKVR